VGDKKMKKELQKNNKGQVTIFIIVGVVIIAVILLILLFRGETGPGTNGKPEENPEAFLQECLSEEVYGAVDEILEHGGYVNPSPVEHVTANISNEFIDIAYLCYYPNYTFPCTHQEPVLHKHLEDEIQNYIAEGVDICFDELMYNLEEQGYTIEVKRQGNRQAGGGYVPRGFNVSIKDEKIVVNIKAEVTLTKSGEISTEKGFTVAFASKLYKLIDVVNDIINDEIINCPLALQPGSPAVPYGFEIIDYLDVYREYNIELILTWDQSKIYSVSHEGSPEIFRFVVRGCVQEPGT
jgi:hypothetical protein